ncbi:hypothetical protein DF185_19975 [Marinifilum breve]|uniref:Uncharacterized protein n=1 Tax=Marinifilum breve TaxID=2184082 RepID=A0A2V3ZRU5_9BACT|nr:hypothetical protein [Marinifilum breve]PXX96921.1 hypothetical protein DF185_19975 [Marinifilum breve]
MIRLKIDSQTLVLDPKTQLRLEMNMPMFDSEAIPPNVVYPFDVPVDDSGINTRIFKHSNYVETWNKKRVYNCQLEFDDSLELYGRLVLLNPTKKKFRISIILNQDNENLKDVKLNKLELQFINAGDIVTYANDAVKKKWPEVPMQFPTIFNSDFYGERKTNDEGQIESNNPAYLEHMNYYNTASGFPRNDANGNKYVMCPQPYLFEVIAKALEKFDRFGSWYEDAEMQKLLIYSNRAMDNRKEGFMKASRNEGDPQEISGFGSLEFPDESSLDNGDPQALFDGTRYTIGRSGLHRIVAKIGIINGGIKYDPERGNEEGIYTYKYRLSLLQESNSVWSYETPFMEGVADGLFPEFVDVDQEVDITEEQVGEKFTFRVEFQAKEDGHLIAGAWGYFAEGYIKITNAGGSIINSFSNTIDMKTLVPELRIGEFLNNLKNQFGLAVFIDSQMKQVEFELIKNIVESRNYIDLTRSVLWDEDFELFEPAGWKFSLGSGSDDEYNDDQSIQDRTFAGEYLTRAAFPVPEENHYAIATKNNSIYVTVYNSEGELDWKYYCGNHEILEIGSSENQKDINSGVSPMLMKDNFIPMIKQEGYTSSFNSDGDKPEFRLMFYHGFEDPQTPTSFPSASSTRFNARGNEVGNLDLRHDGIKGLFKQNWKPWCDFMQYSEEVKRKFLINTQQLLQVIELFGPQKKPAGDKVRKIRVGSINYIPKQFTALLSMNGIEDTESILVKKGGEHE